MTPDTLNLLAALSYAVGGACMKATAGLERPWWLIGVYGGFLLGSTLQSIAMKNEDLGSNYLLVLGLEGIASFCFGLLLFGEQLAPMRVLAVLVIGVGIAMLRS